MGAGDSKRKRAAGGGRMEFADLAGSRGGVQGKGNSWRHCRRMA